MDAEDLVRRATEGMGDFIAGFADLRGLLHESFRGYGYGILVGKRLDDSVVDSILACENPGPTAGYEALYRETNAALSDVVRRIAGSLRSSGIAALAVEPTVPDGSIDGEYRNTLRTELSHKMVGTRAGLGWIGKTALFVSERFGPRVRLATVLTDSPAGGSAAPIDESRCGSCSLCVEWCPAGAATGRPWSIRTDRDEFFDPFKCRETCLELSGARLNKRISICGICVAICPVKGSTPG
jgi:epoxyqueuosine reductase QueG